jgi:hypothetical protein
VEDKKKKGIMFNNAEFNSYYLYLSFICLCTQMTKPLQKHLVITVVDVSKYEQGCLMTSVLTDQKM